MRNLRLCTVFIFVLLASCSTDEKNDGLTGREPILKASRNPGEGPENSNNPFDIAGRLHNAITERYIDDGLEITTIANTIAQVELLEGSNADFLHIRPQAYNSPAPWRIAYLLESQPGRIPETIALSSLSGKAKASFSNYIDTLQVFINQQKEYEILYNFITEFETSVLDDIDFSANDRAILLTTTSISRYSLYMRKKIKRRDRDWEISMGSFLTASDGAANSIAESVTMSVVAGIMANQ